MKRLVFLALFAFAAWYGWKHYDQVAHPRPQHVAVLRNHSQLELLRVRLTVGGRTFVKEDMPAGSEAEFKFVTDKDSPFDLDWENATNTSVGHWTGGLVAAGPIVARHVLTIDDGGGVVLESEPLGVKAAGATTP